MEVQGRTLAELRKVLVEDYGLSPDEVKRLKTKDQALKAITASMFSEGVEFPPMEDVGKIDRPEKENVGPFYGDSDWSDYVLSLLAEDEKDPEGNPRITGLRRLAETLLGDIVDSGPIQTVFTEDKNGGPGRAFVVFQVVFDWRICKKGEYYDIEGMPLPRRVFREVGCCSEQNLDNSKFNVFPEPISSVRAEARCLRRALLLKCVASEELPNTDQSYRPPQAGGISTPQVIFLKKKTESLGVNLEKLIEKEVGKVKLEGLSREWGESLIQIVDGFQRDVNSIPQEIKL